MRFRIGYFPVLAIAIVASSFGQSKAQDATLTPAAIETAVLISPENSNISFVGIHVGDDPKPRLGGFAKFNGYVKVDAAAKSISGVHLDIDVNSVWTEFGKLTGHLKNADFFETDKYPTSSFTSTKIEVTEEGKCTITGDLTLHGESKSISFPAEFQFAKEGLTLSSQFKLDRSMFGMDKMLSGVDKLVSMTFQVGAKTEPKTEQDGHGGGKKNDQSKNESKAKTQQVSLKLPNMT